jgi:hypothetical protein
MAWKKSGYFPIRRLLGFLPNVKGQKAPCAKFDFMDMLFMLASILRFPVAQRESWLGWAELKAIRGRKSCLRLMEVEGARQWRAINLSNKVFEINAAINSRSNSNTNFCSVSRL